MIKAVLFDLDGTLLQMDQDTFIRKYLGALTDKIERLGYDKDILKKGIWVGMGAMIKNDGSKTNEEVFWDAFTKLCGERIRGDIPAFEEFYEKNFDEVSVVAEKDTLAPFAVSEIKKMGYRVALATNPVFPEIATKKRAAWAGLSLDDFELYTTYENSRFCKPNLDYYRAITERLGVMPEECLMVGNDVDDDMVVTELGMKVFLVGKYLINKENKDISRYPQGGFDDLIEYVRSLGDKNDK